MDGDRTAASGPWAAAFDPVANLRAVADVQVRSARAAGEIIERLIARVDGQAAANGTTSSESNLTYGAGGGLDQLVDLWAQLAKGLLQSMAQAGAPWPAGPAGTNGNHSATLDVTAGVPGSTVSLHPGEPGTIWLHNTSQTDVTDIRLHCGELRSHDGHSIPAGAVQFGPDCIALLPSRSSREVTATASVDGEHAPGAYRGTILVGGLPDAWLPVELVLTGP